MWKRGLLLSLCLSAILGLYGYSENANAGSLGQYYANGLSSAYVNPNGNAGTFTKSPNVEGHFLGATSGSETYFNLCLTFPNVQFDSTTTYFNLSFGVYTTSEQLVSAPLVGRWGNALVSVLQDDMTMDTNGGRTKFTHNITGLVDGSGGTMCFSGDWLSSNAGADWEITEPELNLFYSPEQLINSGITNINTTLREMLSRYPTSFSQAFTDIRNDLSAIGQKIDNIDIPSANEVGSAVGDEIQNQKDEERQELTDTTDDAEDASNDAGDDAESATASLSTQIGNIITAIREAPATDCVIDGNMGNVNLGNLDMCQGVPQSIRNRVAYIASGIMVLAILRISYSIIMLFINYVQSFTGGNNKNE